MTPGVGETAALVHGGQLATPWGSHGAQLNATAIRSELAAICSSGQRQLEGKRWCCSGWQLEVATMETPDALQKHCWPQESDSQANARRVELCIGAQGLRGQCCRVELGNTRDPFLVKHVPRGEDSFFLGGGVSLQAQ